MLSANWLAMVSWRSGLGYFMVWVVIAVPWRNADAYLISSYQILENLASAREKLNVNDISAELTATLDGIDAPVEERVFLKAPERMRRVQERPDGENLYVLLEGRHAVGSEGALKSGSAPPDDLTAVLLMPKGSDSGAKANRLVSTLKSLSIDTKTVSLGIYGDDVSDTAYIIGAKPWESDKPQLWVDRVSFQPVRIIYFDSKSRDRIELRLLGYGSPVGGAWFPETVEAFRNGKPVRRSRLTDLRTNDNLPESMFKLP